MLSFLVLSAILGLASVEEAMRLYAGGQQAEARQMLEAIAKAEPANFDAHFRLGLVALNAQDLSTAATSLNRASQLQPAHAQVWLALAQTQRKAKNQSQAAEAAAKAESLAANDPVMLHGLALFHSEGGNWAKAASLESRYCGCCSRRPGCSGTRSIVLSAGRPA